MANPILPDDELTELASAYLDDELAAGERALVEADAEAMRLVQSLATVRTQLAAPVAVASAQRDSHLAAALIAAATAPPLAAAVVVTDLDAVRARRTKRWTTVLAAAAAIVLIAGIGVTVTRGGDDTDGDATSGEVAAAPSEIAAAPTTAAAATTALVATERVETAGGAQKTSPPPSAEDADDAAGDEITVAAAAPFAAPVEVASEEELTAAVDGALGVEAAPLAATNATCTDRPGELLMEISWQGVGALLFVVPSLAAPESAVVVDASTCDELVTIPVP